MNGIRMNSGGMNILRMNHTVLNASLQCNRSGKSTVPDEDTYILRNAILIGDGSVLTDSEGTPVVYTGPSQADESVSRTSIPFNGGMILEKGNTYSQYGKEYECFKSSDNPVYADLKELSIYVNPI